MKRKLLFFDIDGTLLSGGISGFIPDSAIQALKDAQKNGHYLFINSGRPYHFMPQAILDFPFDGYLCGCGTEIIFRGKSLYYHKTPSELVHRIPALLHRTKVQAIFEGHATYFYDDEVDVFDPIDRICNSYRSFPLENPVLTFSHPSLQFDKFVTVYDDDSDFDTFYHEMIKDFDCILREDLGDFHHAEFIPAGHSKSTAMDYITNYLGLSLDDCFAFGDSSNDLSMLEHVSHSVAMGNSVPEIFDHVEYITTPINRDGIQLALKYYGLI